MSNSMIKLIDLLHVPSITKNSIYVSKFSRYSQVYFEFHYNNHFVKSQASNLVLLKGFLDESGYIASTI